MRKKLVCILIMVFLPAQLCFAQESPKEAELLFMAKKAYEDGFYEVSMGMLERFCKEFPGSARESEARLLIGQSYFHQGRYPEALKILDGLLSDPKASKLKDAVYFWIAEVYFKSDDFEKASGFYRKLIGDFPRSSYVPAAYYSLGWTYSQMGRYNEALISLKSLLESFPSEPQSKDAAFKLMECLYNLKEYSELKKKIQSVLKLYVDDPLRLPYLYFYLAESEYYLDELEEAAKNYYKAAQSFKDEKARVLANLGLGWSYLKIKKFGEAQEVFAGIKQEDLDGKSLDIFLLGQAVLMSQSNRVYEAKKFYRQILDTSSDPLIRLQAYIGEADVFYNLAEYAQAIKVSEEGLNKVSGLPVQYQGASDLIDKLRYNLGLTYIKKGDPAKGISVFTELADKSIDPAVKSGALCQIGDVYQDSGDYPQAREAYSKVLKYFPGSAYADYALYQKGITQLKAADYKSAEDSFKLLSKDYPRSRFREEAAFSLGMVNFDKQDYAVSIDALVKFQGEFKDSHLAPQAVFMLGLAWAGMGKFDEAINIFKEIPRRYPQDTELTHKSEYEIADCYYKLGQEKEALKRFKLLRTKYPDSGFTPEIIWWLGRYYYRQNDLNLASRYLGSLAKDFPGHPLAADALYALGLVYKDGSNFEQALESFESSLKITGSGFKKEAALAIADIYFQQERTEDALAGYKALFKEYPDLAPLVLPRIAKCYYRMLDYSQAKVYFQKAIDLSGGKDAGDMQFSLAEVYEAANEPDKACGFYLKIADTYKDDRKLVNRSLLRCAKIYEDRDDFKTALDIYDRVVQDGSEESGFAGERAGWIRANIK